MKVGDLVRYSMDGTIGIITAQIGVVDRWWVVWTDGTTGAINGCNLEYV